MVKPLAITMLPVMVGTLVSMLQGYPVLSVIYIGFPIALVLAFIWTWIRLRSEVCEILISHHKVAIRSIYAAAIPVEDFQWKLLIDLHEDTKGARLTLGLEEFSLSTADWPTWRHLSADLSSAFLQAPSDENR